MTASSTHIAGRAALQDAWRRVVGREATRVELQIAGAQADLESGYGRASYKLLDHATGGVIASSGPINNWGAVQTSEGPPGGFLATDTSSRLVTADNPKGYYDHHYKVYATPADGAAHLVEHLVLKRPTSWAYAMRGDIDGWAREARAYVEPGGKVHTDPATGIPGYFEQSSEGRAHGIEIRVAEIAAAFGEPIEARRGGPTLDAPEAEPTGSSGPIAAWRQASAAQRAVAAGGVGAFVGALLLALWRLFGRR
jgi:hypothetical protein